MKFIESLEQLFSKYKIPLTIMLSVVSILLFIANYNYPFFYNHNKPWEVGYNISKNLDSKLIISQENIISSVDIINKGPNIGSYFIADPFFIVNNDTIFLFVESFIAALVALFMSISASSRSSKSPFC